MINWPPTDSELHEYPVKDLAASFHFTEELRNLRTWFGTQDEMIDWIKQSMPDDDSIHNDLWEGTIGKTGMLGRHLENLNEQGVMYYQSN